MEHDVVAELEIQGRRARQECRTRSPSPLFLNGEELAVYQRAWDAENETVNVLMGYKR